MLKQPRAIHPIMAGLLQQKMDESLRVLQRRTESAVAAPAGPQPLFETNLQETLGIRKFLVMSLEDMRQQIATAAQDPKVTRAHFNRMKVNAMVITAWLTSALAMVNQMLGAAAQPEQETEQ
jgi:hypothetical protein